MVSDITPLQTSEGGRKLTGEKQETVGGNSTSWSSRKEEVKGSVNLGIIAIPSHPRRHRKSPRGSTSG